MTLQLRSENLSAFPVSEGIEAIDATGRGSQEKRPTTRQERLLVEARGAAQSPEQRPPT